MLPAGWTGRESTANYSKLGFNVAQSSVAKHMVKRREPPSQGWETFCQTTFQTLPWICSWSQAFPWDEAPRYMIAGRDQIYGAIVTRPLRAMGNHVFMRYAFIEGIASDGRANAVQRHEQHDRSACESVLVSQTIQESLS
jgi:hypothetical protein